MKGLAGLVFLSVALMAYPPTALATPASSPGCMDRAETCDPVLANDGQVKEGRDAVRMILFAHMRDLLQRAPLNLDPPAEWEADINAGFLMPTIVTDEDLPCCGFENNRFLWYLSPGPVQLVRDGGWRVAPGPGLGDDLELASPAMTGYWYMSPSTLPPQNPGGMPLPGVMPAVGVYMAIETARIPGQGRIIAEGDTGTGFGRPTPAGAMGTVTMVSAPGMETVYEFEVPLTATTTTLPFESGSGSSSVEGNIIVHVIPYQVEIHDPDVGRASVSQADWKVRTGPDHPPRLVLDVVAPMQSEGLRIERTQRGDELEWSVLSPLGQYAIDGASVALRIGDGAVELPDHESEIHWPYLHHSEARSPVRFTWLFPPDAAFPDDGTYGIELSVLDRTGTYRLVHTPDLLIQDGRLVDPAAGLADLDVPSVGPLLLAMALAGAAALARRRR